MVDATGRIIGWLGALAIVYVVLRGSAPAYLQIVGL